MAAGLMVRRAICILFCAAAAWAAEHNDSAREIVSYLKSGQYAQAEQLLQAGLKSSPRDARLWTLNGLALEKLGERASAKRAFKRALNLAPDYFPALEGAAQMAYEDGDPHAAALLKRILQIRPGDRTSHALLAKLAFKKGECESAKEEFAAARPESGQAAPLLEYGECLVAHKKAPAAVPVFAQLRGTAPGNQDFIYESAIANFLAGRFAEAVRLLNGLTDKNADAYDLLAEAYAAKGQGQQAGDAMRRALAMKPDDARYYADYVYLLQESGDFKQGLAVANEGIRRLPKAASLYVARGVMYSELGRYALSAADFERARVLDPNVELAAAAEGLSDVQKGDLAAAEKTVRKRLTRRPNDAFLHYLLAAVLLRRGAAPGTAEFKEALAAAQTAVQLQPKLALARDTLGQIYLEAGDLPEAIAQSKAACRLSPDDEKALYHLIVALRRAHRTAELPPLLRRFTMLRTQARAAKTLEQGRR